MGDDDRVSETPAASGPTSDAGPTLDEWAARVAAALDLPEDLAGLDVRQLVLDLARDAARGVARPAAPLTTFLAGVALGSTSGTAGISAAEALAAVADRIRAELPAE
jgi:hypothetical protein